jgi:nitric oxide reductase subunit C
MLTKSQARTFFVGGTVLFSAVFVALTVDTHTKIPRQTNEHLITPQVSAGKRLWEHNNCMGCHTLFGEGAYYAPELTKVVDRRGVPWLKVFLKDPEAMFPGERQMVKYDWSDGDIDNMIAFLDWCGKVDLNGFPAEPPLREVVDLKGNAVIGVSAAVPEPPLVMTQLCFSCHAVRGKGGVVGPPLDDVHKRLNHDQLVAWIGDPQKIKPGTTMPKLPLTPEQVEEATQYILSLGQTK